MRSKTFAPRDLVRVADPLAQFRIYAVPLVAGDRCRLNSGGPVGLVLDVDGDKLTVAWDSLKTANEYTFQRACLHRYNP